MHARLIWINGLLAILISLPIFLSLSGAALNQIMKRSPLKKFPSTLLSSLQVSIRGEFFALRRLCYYLLIFILLAIFYSAIIYEGSLFVRAIFCFFAALLLFLGFGRAFSTLISPLVAAIFHFEPLAAYNEAFSLCMHKRREILLLLLISIGIVLGGLFVRDELCRVAMNYIGGGYIYLGILGLIRQTYP